MPIFSDADIVRIDDLSELPGLRAGGSRFALRAAASCVLEPAALRLLCAELDANAQLAAVCPLRLADVRLELESDLPAATLQRALYWSQPRQHAMQVNADEGCMLVAIGRWPGPIARVNHVAVDGLAACGADVALLLAALRTRSGFDALPEITDERPVDLHITHAWGGGSERWVDDYCVARADRLGLVLQSHSALGREIHGARYTLKVNGPSGPEIREWVLPQAIESCVDAHADHAAMLAQLCAEFGVDQVLVSSLIGHSIDALRLPIATAVVLHDYFPAWPQLDVRFAADQQFGLGALTDALRSQSSAPFRAQPAQAWMRLRTAYFAALKRTDLIRIAPSQSVLVNLSRLGLDPLPIHVIAHGIRPLPAPRYTTATPFTVLVLGRIEGGKGEDLVAQLLAHLTPSVRVVLLGAGRAAGRFFAVSGVDIVAQYSRSELPQWIARLRPDLALLPSLVAETFSYTLSELNALGVPTLATHRGSFPDRIDPGVNGFLAAPEGAAVAAEIARLQAAPEQLDQVRARLRLQPHRDIADMAADYRLLLPSLSIDHAPGASQPQGLVQAFSAALQLKLRDVERNQQRLRADLGERDVELAKRAQWGYGLQAQLEERGRWAQSLQQDLQRTQQQTAQLQRDFDERSAWALERNEAANVLQASLADAERKVIDVNQQLVQREAEIKAREAQLDANVAELGRMHRILSWKPHLKLVYRGRVLRLKAEFALKRVKNLVQRVRLSLAARGWWETLNKASQTLLARPSQARHATHLNLISLDEFLFKPFAVASSERPQVSVVVPVYNKYPYTDACLRALDAAAGALAFEVIVIDDASNDASAVNLAQVGGIRYLRNEQNLGFIGSCNRAAMAASGEFIVMLNNDTQVQPGWLEALLETFEQFPDCGMSGAKLVYPDGRLQEAGGVIFADGSGWNYGRLEDPQDPRFNYPREVDYISGAAICLRRSQWEAFGGFDERYKPAYYEDTDMAFRVREAGLKVIYQPRAVVVHFEGISSGTDVATGIKRFQVINQQKFLARWREALKLQPLPRGHEIIDRAREHRVAGRVLIVDATTPTPDQDSGSVRMFNLMRLLIKRNYKVSFFADNRAFVPGYSDALQQLGVEFWCHPYLSEIEAFFVRYGPLFDVIVLSRHYVASLYIDFVRRYAPKARLIFDTVDLHYLREERQADLEGNASLRDQAASTRAAELGVMARCDATLVVSPAEVEELKRATPATNVQILSNVVEAKGCRKPFSERSDIWFIGGFQHTPNVDAMRFFVQQVMPLLNQATPHLKLNIVGSKMPDEVKKMARPSVVIHGQLPDVEPFLDNCLALVAPLRFGAGVKGKINMAMAYGQPVISTALGVEGMYLKANSEVLIANTGDEFAAAVSRLVSDESLWSRLSRAGLANVEQHFSFAAADRALDEILQVGG